ncbi:Dihydrolipoyllysine-residue succinyltransferase component of 2-oxoglutarate dehydrogenase complex [Vibrio coralliirubri]|uniref:2-oxoglutarate dehydrogenase complex dihydrolipoyllysine-residue succinyltransferase n=1 Tax=Vibrio coralliirubri TaxID=1516159 RepID=UPI00063820A6|nr:2-oxoglutarate dehydrogenase complex dihydrolipoyllysine-residue succinyltransferase [Vibrio coralliirubri]CDT24670.1 Dihydrolipoyllysine-residue succinyltransferase component of 2-oxoglutarate dehydrogenase complex [Vibrio coralliirubri]CDT29765.1 Dihydrolipoyllysine-residue succinyltransferase component of 2-oxoglutarate dehydrogenase complex [Vibrio coralliirubri]CDT43410.1 Dihydrolipoyllysine-residue succinyltransferase component of 2-oxoglutarate dehydrogenase complex [Vibrio coralliirub
MTIEILVPDLPESVADATVATWHKKPGEAVARDEVIVDIETDKVVLEVPAPEAGVLEAIIEEEGATVLSKQLLAKIKPGAVAGEPTKDTTEDTEASPDKRHKAALTEENNDALSPAVRRLLAEHNLQPADVKGTGVGGRITREDIDAHLAAAKAAPAAASTPAVEAPAAARSQKRVPMTRLRKTVANRLLEAKNSTAMLTTFNEVNMKPIMDLRKQYKDQFEKRHDTRLGFMSFYVKAVTEALKRFPEVNASIDGTDIVYHNYFDISMAVSTPRGLVTPVLKDCDTLGFADIEKGIKELAIKGRDGKLTVDELMGGNFTITNGGVFGSLMSTPIINPPQAAILGMHKIQDRPMAVDGKVEILPMMYLALSYDHRLIDGRESVGFLVTIKELLEDPARLLLDV